MDSQAYRSLQTTDFSFPGQTGLYHGKVRDVYQIGQDLLVSIATDRISAFDVVLPRGIPYKGQVLNQLAAYFLQATEDIVPNWLQATPDPNVSVGRKASPFKIEMVIRGFLVGHAWRQYNAGVRELCGSTLPEGMQEYDKLPEPIITPATKAETGHDEDIAPDEIIAQKLASAKQWQRLADYTQQLFARGQSMAAERGLILADTKYEFGLVGGKIILIDEVHTPDSSRYFYKESYEDYLKDRSLDTPRHLSKEFVRAWLMDNDFSGQDGQVVPRMTDEFVDSVSARYIELYEELTGKRFAKADTEQVYERIENSVKKYLQTIKTEPA